MSRFSSRLQFQAATNLIARRLHDLRTTGAHFHDLTETNPTLALSDYPHTAIAGALGKLTDFTYHPDPRGAYTARTAIAAFYASRGLEINPERIVLTASTSEAYTYVFKLLCDAGDAVISPVPSYPLFEHLAGLASVNIKPYHLRYDGAWHIDFAHLRSQISAGTKAIVVVNPNNPTGHFLDPREAAALQALAAEFQLPIVSDEVFLDYPLADSDGIGHSLLQSDLSPVLAMNGLSKACGMPQMKLAWIAVGGPQTYCDEALDRLELISDTYLSVATPVQRALPALLRIGDAIRAEIRSRIKANWLAVQEALAGTTANPYHLEAGWSVIIRMPETMAEEDWVLKLMTDHQVIVQPGYFFDITGGAHIVLSLLTKPEMLAAGLHAIREALSTQA